MRAPRGAARASRIGALGFTALALVLTGLTAFLLSRMIAGSQYATEPVKDVVVAAKEIPAGEAILEDHLKLVKYPASSVPEGAFNSIDDLLGPKARAVSRTLYPGEPVIKARLASKERGTGMASQVAERYRGFPVPVDNWVSNARLVYPGALVDVLVTMRNPVSRSVSTKLVLQARRVLAVNGNIEAMEADKKKGGAMSGGRVGRKTVVTLLVSPQEAEILALSSREGKVDLMLRNPGDETTVETLGVSPGELLGEPEPEDDELAPAVKPPPARSRRRARRTVKPVPRGEVPARARGRRGHGRSKTIKLGAE